LSRVAEAAGGRGAGTGFDEQLEIFRQQVEAINSLIGLATSALGALGLGL
jgi:hypothetical protein